MANESKSKAMVTDDDDDDDVDNVDVDENDGGADDSDDDDGGTNQGEEPVTFESKAAYQKHVDGFVKKRIARIEKKYAPVVQERDTLKKRVDELSGADKDKSAAEQQIASLSQQVNELLTAQKTTQRAELVRSIAKEHGLPDEFLSRIQGDDEDSIAEDVEELVALLQIDPTKTTTTVTKKVAPKTTKPVGKDGKGGKGSDGKGGQDDDSANDLDALAKDVGRYGHRAIVLG